MSIIQKIKADQLAARKDRDAFKSSLLTTVIGEAEAVGKNKGNRAPTDDEVVALITKFIKNVKETINVLPEIVDKTTFLNELDILNAYLPQKMSAQELNIAVANAIMTVGPTKGLIMGHFKKNHAGLYDGAELAKMVDSAINA